MKPKTSKKADGGTNDCQTAEEVCNLAPVISRWRQIVRRNKAIETSPSDKEEAPMSKKLIAVFLYTSFVLLVGCAGKNAQPNASPASPTPSKSNKVKAEVTTEPHWDQVSPGISLQVKVEKGVDSSNSTPDSPRYKYDVSVNLKNTGSSTIIFDAAEAAFLPGEGEPFRARTVEGIHEIHGNSAYVTSTTFSRGERNQRAERMTFKSWR